jgi:hypothetical protein
MNFIKWLAAVFITLGLISCGGGGSNDTSATSGSYLAVTGTKQVAGNPIVTVCLNNVSTDVTANSLKGDIVAGNLARFYYISGNYEITSSNYLNCSNLPGAVTVSVSDYNTIILPWIASHPPASTGSTSTNTTSSTGTTTTTTNSTANDMVTFPGNVNGGGIRDASNDLFWVRASDRNVLWAKSSTELIRLSGLTVDTQWRLLDGTTPIGNILYLKTSTGSDIAVFHCNDGTQLNITVTASGWSQNCAASSSTGTTGSGTSGSSTSGGTTTNSYYSWTGSSQSPDYLILDRNGQFFGARSSNGQMVYGPNSAEIVLIGLFNGTGSDINASGVQIGYVGMHLLQNGGQGATLFCNNNAIMAIAVNTTTKTWSHSC